MICPKCGNESGNSKFCPECGEKLLVEDAVFDSKQDEKENEENSVIVEEKVVTEKEVSEPEAENNPVAGIEQEGKDSDTSDERQEIRTEKPELTEKSTESKESVLPAKPKAPTTSGKVKYTPVSSMFVSDEKKRFNKKLLIPIIAVAVIIIAALSAFIGIKCYTSVTERSLIGKWVMVDSDVSFNFYDDGIGFFKNESPEYSESGSLSYDWSLDNDNNLIMKVNLFVFDKTVSFKVSRKGKELTLSPSDDSVFDLGKTIVLIKNGEPVTGSDNEITETDASGEAIDENYYDDENEFETDINSGIDMIGKTVSFVAKEIHPDSAAGYNIWAGEHLNFVSNSDPGVLVGQTVKAKVTEAESIDGEDSVSWIIHYEIIDITGEGTTETTTETTTEATTTKATTTEANTTRATTAEAIIIEMSTTKATTTKASTTRASTTRATTTRRATSVDYANESLLERDLNNGVDVTGKTVTFTADELHPDSAFGYNIWSGEHLNFVSSNNPGIRVGEKATVKITDVSYNLGSYIIYYEKV